MYNICLKAMTNPSPEDIEHWKQLAERRNAILPYQFEVLPSKEASIYCGECRTHYVRPMIVAENNPVFVCPSCQARNYIPIDWNVIRRRRSNY